MPAESNLAVVDASVAFKWQFNEEECSNQAIALRDNFYFKRVIYLIAPQLFIYEITNGIVMATRRQRIPANMALQAVNNILSFNIEFRAVEPSSILSLALKHNLTAYDAAYLALAEKENCDLWTGDKALYQTMKGKTPRVRWIGDYGGGK